MLSVHLPTRQGLNVSVHTTRPIPRVTHRRSPNQPHQRVLRSIRVAAAAAAPARRTAKGRTDLQGLGDWEKLIAHDGKTTPRSINEDLRRTLIKYGELTQVTYDSFYGDAKDSDTFGLNKYPPEALFPNVLLDPNSPLKTYTAVKYFYAESGMPPLRTDFITGRKMNRYWQGYAAISEPDAKGLRDVVFAWRGTIAGSEWSMDVQSAMVNYEGDREIGVAEGFSTMYMVAQKRSSPQEQVKKLMPELYKKYGNTIGSLTVCGHSLGGALAHICAFDLGDKELNKRPDGTYIPITAYTFCSPRVGDKEFKDACDALDVKVLRTVNRRDIVPKVPGLSKDELDGRYVTNNDGADGGSFKLLEGFDINDPVKGFQQQREKAAQRLKSLKEDTTQRFRDGVMAFGTKVYRRVEASKPDQYDEVGTVLELDTEEFPTVIKKGGNLVGAAGRAHNLEVLLHMIDPKRDPALCNKSEDALVDKKIPPAWFGLPLKGMHLDPKDGKWRRAYPPHTEPEAEEPGIGQKTIDEATQSFKMPDMSGALGKLPSFGGFGRKK